MKLSRENLSFLPQLSKRGDSFFELGIETGKENPV